MAINDPRKVDIVKAFSRRKFITEVLLYAAGAGVAFSAFSLSHRTTTFTGLPYSIGIIIGAFVIVLALAGLFYVWRCPVCHKFLGFKTNIKACNNCAVVFRGAESDKEKKDSNNDAAEYFRYITIWKKNSAKFFGYLVMVLVINIGLIALCANVTVFNFLKFLVPFTTVIPILVLSNRFQRCPNCGHYFGRYTPVECPECGVRIKDYEPDDDIDIDKITR
jgi:hypothetical protein